ncbi:MAG: hypothetical protein UR89_C0015G0008 [Candidatus Roizmanbacteria bacterium GW2011_GWA2_35_8]|uniref:Uncharacterized protein n=1 Tax=Candidatus Roizmanbacteria bacterium GW2011_GWA2_35_8 TaxID=1618479 RepID=A0A0G0FGX2_9BACT|nr:MAG: hypothetical protein UR89_C0015G0008 [Candidatus Roizmanbacteria bacterium GW2011_GWA2_35_8]
MIIFLAYYFIVCVFPIFLLNKFGPKIDEPEWKEINRMNAYMRSPEFIKRRDKLLVKFLKGGDQHE